MLCFVVCWFASCQASGNFGCSPNKRVSVVQHEPEPAANDKGPSLNPEARLVATAHSIPKNSRAAALRLLAVVGALREKLSKREVSSGLGGEVTLDPGRFVVLDNQARSPTVSSLLEERGKKKVRLSWLRHRVQFEGQAERIKLEGETILADWRQSYDQELLLDEVLALSSPRSYQTAQVVAARALEPFSEENPKNGDLVLLLWGPDESLAVHLQGGDDLMMTIAPGYPMKGEPGIVFSGHKDGLTIGYRVSRVRKELVLEVRFVGDSSAVDGTKWSTFARVPLKSSSEIPLQVFLGPEEQDPDLEESQPLVRL